MRKRRNGHRTLLLEHQPPTPHSGQLARLHELATVVPKTPSHSSETAYRSNSACPVTRTDRRSSLFPRHQPRPYQLVATHGFARTPSPWQHPSIIARKPPAELTLAVGRHEAHGPPRSGFLGATAKGLEGRRYTAGVHPRNAGLRRVKTTGKLRLPLLCDHRFEAEFVPGMNSVRIARSDPSSLACQLRYTAIMEKHSAG